MTSHRLFRLARLEEMCISSQHAPGESVEGFICLMLLSVYGSPLVHFLLLLFSVCLQHGTEREAPMPEGLPQGHPETLSREEPGHAPRGRGRRQGPAEGEVGEQARLRPVRGRRLHRIRKRLAFPLPLLQKRWR